MEEPNVKTEPLFSLVACFEILSAHWIGMGCILGGKMAQQIEPKTWETHSNAFAVVWASSDLGLLTNLKVDRDICRCLVFKVSQGSAARHFLSS